MDTAKIEAGVRMILEGVGENPDREGLKETPARVARMYEEVFAGLTEDPAVHFATTFCCRVKVWIFASASAARCSAFITRCSSCAKRFSISVG